MQITALRCRLWWKHGMRLRGSTSSESGWTRECFLVEFGFFARRSNWIIFRHVHFQTCHIRLFIVVIPPFLTGSFRFLLLLLLLLRFIKSFSQPYQARMQEQQVGGRHFQSSQLLRFHGRLHQVVGFLKDHIKSIHMLERRIGSVGDGGLQIHARFSFRPSIGRALRTTGCRGCITGGIVGSRNGSSARRTLGSSHHGAIAVATLRVFMATCRRCSVHLGWL